jgi:hypothetical protein
MRRKLMDIVANNFDIGSEKYDASTFRSVVVDEIKKIEFPAVKVDCSAEINQITAKFSGEITDSAGKDNLREALRNAVSGAFDALDKQMERSVSTFKASLNDIGAHLQEKLLAGINNEYNEIAALFQDKEKKIEELNRYMRLLDEELKGLQP